MGSTANQSSSAFDPIPSTYPTAPTLQVQPDPPTLKSLPMSDSQHPRIEDLQNSQANILSSGSGPPSSYPDASLSIQTAFQGARTLDSPTEMVSSLKNNQADFLPERGIPHGSDRLAGESLSIKVPENSVDGSTSFDQIGSGSLDGSEGISPESSRWPGSARMDFGQESSPSDNPRHASSGIEDHRASVPKDDNEDHAPAWSDLKTKAGKERKRLPLACIACRRKKIRCSGEKPGCKHCLRSRIPCVYKVTTRKAAPRTDYMAMLDRRLKRMEDRVIKIIPKDDVGGSSPFARAAIKPVTPGSAAWKAGNKKRVADEAFGAELDEWAKVRSGADDRAEPRRPRPTDAERSLLTDGADALPSLELREHLVEVYFDCVYGQAYHLLHKPSFMRKLRAGKVPPVLMFAICAVSARFSNHPEVNTQPAFLRGETWAAEAGDIVRRRYDEPNLTLLIVLLILALHGLAGCQGGRSWAFSGMAFRMAYALQLHRELDPDPRAQSGSSELSFTDREIRRRTMWACFMMDRFTSSGTDRPTFIDESTMKIQLPIKESHFQREIPGVTEKLDGSKSDLSLPSEEQSEDPNQNLGVAAYVARIVAFWGRVMGYLTLGGKDKDPHPLWSPESHFAAFQAQAEEFRRCLPESLQYTPENLHTHATERLANQFLFLHIAYHGTLLSMNRHAIPAASNSKLLADAPKDYHANMLRQAIENAKEISNLIGDSASHLVTAPFVGYCAFVSSLVHIWGIFSKNPELDDSSKKNLALNVKYLSKMKNYWGTFHFMAENLKETYRQYADAALDGSGAAQARSNPPKVANYGDWFDRYPRGVSRSDYQIPADEETGGHAGDALLSQKSDLQSVEEFFAGLTTSPKDKAEPRPSKRQVSRRNMSPRKEDEAFSRPHSERQASEQMARNPDQPSKDQMMATTTQNTAPDFVPGIPHLDGDPLNLFQAQHPQTAPATFPANSFPPDYSLLGAQQQNLFPQLHRQFVFGGSADLDPVTTTLGLNDHSWDMSATGMEPGTISDTSNAWFMPFNIPPPQLDGEPDGSGIYGTTGAGVGGYVQSAPGMSGHLGDGLDDPAMGGGGNV